MAFMDLSVPARIRTPLSKMPGYAPLWQLSGLRRCSVLVVGAVGLGQSVEESLGWAPSQVGVECVRLGQFREVVAGVAEHVPLQEFPLGIHGLDEDRQPGLWVDIEGPGLARGGRAHDLVRR